MTLKEMFLQMADMMEDLELEAEENEDLIEAVNDTFDSAAEIVKDLINKVDSLKIYQDILDQMEE